MPLPIVVDVGVTDPARELTSTLVEACSHAAAETECHMMREAPEGPYAAIAIVTWEAEDRVRIEVGLRRETGAEWRSRLITFQPADVELERYRSVGFVIGTLATSPVDEAGEPPPQPKPPPAPAPKPEPPPPVPPLEPPPAERKEAAESSVSRGFVGLSGLVGAGLDQGAPRFGGNLRAGIRIVERFAVLVTGGASTRPRDDQGLMLTWLDAGLGVAYAVGSPSSTHLELRLEFIGEHFSADASTPTKSEELARTQACARFGVDGVLRLSRAVSLIAGVDVTFRPSKTHIRVDEEDAGSTLVVDPSAALGLRFEL